MTRGRADDLPYGNRVLDSLPGDVRTRLTGHLEEVDLPFRQPLVSWGGRFEYVYFPVRSVVSLVTRVKNSPAVEVASIGNEGLVGVPLSWGADELNPYEQLQVQVPGRALRIGTGAFLSELDRSDTLRLVVSSFTTALLSQLVQQVACAALHSVEERCARWLLLSNDRAESDELPVTQEFLSQMLGVRRPSVTVAAGGLQQAGYIRYHRGTIVIIDRRGLERSSCACYRLLRESFDRLLPPAH